MASRHEQILEKRQKFQIVYVGPANHCQHSTTDLARGIITNERKQSVLSKARSFKHSKTTSVFLYLIYHQRAGKTSLFHMRGVDFKHFNTCCTFNSIVSGWNCDLLASLITQLLTSWFFHIDLEWPEDRTTVSKSTPL